MRKEIKILFTAIMFYTRIPCPSWVGYSEEQLNKATRYFPFIGWLVGGFAALVFWASSLVFPASLAILLSMASSILLTGAFHEDGFADSCDGLGGGTTIEKRLEIMKDSRIGTYGAIGIIFMLAMKFSLLTILPGARLPLFLLAAHSLSRLAPVCVVLVLPYARHDALSKTKPIGKGITWPGFLIAFIFAVAPVFIIGITYFLALPVVFMVAILAAAYFKSRLSGYTGDCLGATQQVAEVMLYMTFYIIQSLLTD